MIVVTEDQAKLLLLGVEALSGAERWLLAWLLDRPGRMSIAFEEVAAGLGIGFRAFGDLCARWRECGLLTIAYSDDYDAFLPQATDYAALVLLLDPVQWASNLHSDPVDLDEMELAA
ncbi:hypothetical protein [Nocardia sp. NPDC003963]